MRLHKYTLLTMQWFYCILPENPAIENSKERDKMKIITSDVCGQWPALKKIPTLETSYLAWQCNVRLQQMFTKSTGKPSLPFPLLWHWLDPYLQGRWLKIILAVVFFEFCMWTLWTLQLFNPIPLSVVVTHLQTPKDFLREKNTQQCLMFVVF